ncbi:hypothetical protein amrb99_91330 [Actinomadura sp. RB99]|uniref:epoxide hydrolase N-terminal domain-containing protein n=1 Tax=Actinomadura sp. RB99 TaxID=2691577 RepID=UPI0016884C07|nr:epoxide hydrolase N-terminal domain-containing protein [Actinomadura sp. RB99]MBD2900133.1 hypothetical protein [Actinomadura sp. RB99]
MDFPTASAVRVTTGEPAGPVQPGWEYGVPVSFVRDLVARWRDEYDWRAHEARLNAVPQFTTEIDGQLVHFAHVRSPEPDATPLILTHGWPNTFAEYLGLIGPLTGFYYENAHEEKATEPTTFPIGLASFAYDFRPLRRFAERDHTTIVHWNEYDRGSHWAAHDAPDLLVADIREFFTKLA